MRRSYLVGQLVTVDNLQRAVCISNNLVPLYVHWQRDPAVIRYKCKMLSVFITFCLYKHEAKTAVEQNITFIKLVDFEGQGKRDFTVYSNQMNMIRYMNNILLLLASIALLWLF